MKKTHPEDSTPAEAERDSYAERQLEQTLRFAHDLRAIMDSHERLQADYQQLVGKEERLLDRDDAFNQLLQDNRNLYLSTDRWGRIIHANPAAAAFLNITVPRGDNLLRLLPEGLVKAGKSLQVEIDESMANSPVTLMNAAGEEREFSLRVIQGGVEHSNKSVMHWLFFPQGDSEQDLSWTLATTVFNSAGEGIVVIDDRGLILTVNPAFSAMTGFEVQDMVGSSPGRLIVHEDNDAYFNEIWQALQESGQWQGRVQLRHQSGGLTQVWLALTVTRDGGGRINSCIGLVSDMAPLLKIERHLEYAANYDALTNLPNRSLLLNRLENALGLARRQNQSVSLLFIDLDGFKAANDRHGHDFGDIVLQEVSSRLSSQVRESDTVARYGGDEFVLILYGMESVADVEVFADKLLDGARRAIRHHGVEAHIGFSIGCAQYPRHAEDSAGLLQMADAAMYMAKSAGGSQLQMFQGFANAEKSQRRTLCAIETAFEQERLRLVYQPQFDIRQNPPRLIGVEALLRCQASTGEVMPSPEILPSPELLLQSAARSRLTGRLTQWVLETACRQLREWHAQGLKDLGLTVNLSLMQLRDHRLSQMVQAAMDGFQMERNRLRFDAPLNFDLNSAASLYQVEGGREQLKLLRRLGVSLTLEDSLDQRFCLRDLSDIPLSRLKVGPDTVSRLGGDSRAEVQCRAVAALGQVFGLKAGAVGIETSDQLSALKAMGYDFGQGYLLGKPMLADDFWSWVGAEEQRASAS
jgi:diguanylate cyclase (GGDEF)-like protein/PAS domain S-box-containing protein